MFDTGQIRLLKAAPDDWLPQPQELLLVVHDSGLQRLGDIAMPPVLSAVQALNSGLLKGDDPVAPV